MRKVPIYNKRRLGGEKRQRNVENDIKKKIQKISIEKGDIKMSRL